MSTKPFGLLLSAMTLVACGASDDASDDTNNLPSPSDDLKDTESGEDTDTGNDKEEPEDTDVPVDTSVAYTFSDKDSLLYVQVFKDPDTLLSGFAHNHVIRATKWTGSLVYDLENPSACELDFALPVRSLVVDEDNMRSLVGYGDSISSADRETITEHMLDTTQLNGSTFGKIEFASTTCSGPKGAKNGQLNVQGKLKVLGVPVTVSIPVDFNIKDERFYAKGAFDMSMWDFGMEPYSAFGGGVRNKEALYYSFDMVGAAN